jgi:MerR family transcriptional regulator, redox-sensitive transcriptional activator SoxR
MPSAPLSIGELARRAGLASSALRFYESQGLISGTRTEGGHRLYPRHVLRRVGFIRAAQMLGLSLPAIREALSTLPAGRTPTKADWAHLARTWRPMLDARIAALQRLRDRLDGCIGCGCLSLKTCALYNPEDVAGTQGAGARFLAPRPTD